MPAAQGALDLLVHDAERRLHALVVEGREHDPARLLVEVAVDREHPVAEQRDQVAEAAVAPAEAVGVGDEHEVVRLRAEHEDVARVEDPQREDRAVALVGLEQQVQRVGDHPVRAADAQRGVAGRVAAARAALRLQLESDAPQRVGADRLGPGQGHGCQPTRVQRLPLLGIVISAVCLAAVVWWALRQDPPEFPHTAAEWGSWSARSRSTASTRWCARSAGTGCCSTTAPVRRASTRTR